MWNLQVYYFLQSLEFVIYSSVARLKEKLYTELHSGIQLEGIFILFCIRIEFFTAFT